MNYFRECEQKRASRGQCCKQRESAFSETKARGCFKRLEKCWENAGASSSYRWKGQIKKGGREKKKRAICINNKTGQLSKACRPLDSPEKKETSFQSPDNATHARLEG